MGGTSIDVFKYEVPEGVSEYHAMLRVTDSHMSYEEQVGCLLEDYKQLLAGDLKGAVPVFMRFFLSDAANQVCHLREVLAGAVDCPLSVVEQSPLDGTKVALWVYLQKGVQTKSLSHGIHEVKHGAYRHLWMAGSC